MENDVKDLLDKVIESSNEAHGAIDELFNLLGVKEGTEHDI